MQDIQSNIMENENEWPKFHRLTRLFKTKCPKFLKKWTILQYNRDFIPYNANALLKFVFHKYITDLDSVLGNFQSVLEKWIQKHGDRNVLMVVHYNKQAIQATSTWNDCTAYFSTQCFEPLVVTTFAKQFFTVIN